MVMWGPIISAVIAGGCTLIGAYLQIAKPNNPRPLIAVLSLVFIIIAISGTVVLWEPKNQWDKWDIWSDKITNSIKNCIDSQLSDISCVQNSLEKYVNEIPSTNAKNEAAYHYDATKTGEILMNIEEVKKVFRTYFGIHHDTFLGTGTVTLGDNKYKNFQVREYLIPNLCETHPNIWTWRFSTDRLLEKGEMTVKEFIERIPPDANSNSNDIALVKKQLFDRLYDLQKQPPVIRFQKFPENLYQKSVGRPIAHRVFTINLADVVNLRLQQAMDASGFSTENDNDNERDTKYFVWLFIPIHDSEIEPATWKNVIQKASAWLKEGKNGMSCARI